MPANTVNRRSELFCLRPQHTLRCRWKTEAADLILTLTIGTTVLFELTGPFMTLWAIRRVEKRG